MKISLHKNLLSQYQNSFTLTRRHTLIMLGKMYKNITAISGRRNGDYQKPPKISVQASRPWGGRVVLKYAAAVLFGAAVAGYVQS